MRLDDMPESGNVEDRRGDGGGFGGGGGGGLPIGERRARHRRHGGARPGRLGARHRSVAADQRRQRRHRRSGRLRAARSAHRSRIPRAAPARRATRPASSSLACSAAPRWCGRTSSPRKARPIARRKLVMFSGQTRSACGAAQSAMGPFYCPNDREVYLDTSFFNDLERRFRGCSGKACQFAQAYVIAHEVGHHVQNLLGILPKVQQAQRSLRRPRRSPIACRCRSSCRPTASPASGRRTPRRNTSSSIRATSTRRCRPRPRSATTRCSGNRRARVVPDSFTHGSAEQRKRWFMTGFKEGTVKACNTFAAARL